MFCLMTFSKAIGLLDLDPSLLPVCRKDMLLKTVLCHLRVGIMCNHSSFLDFCWTVLEVVCVLFRDLRRIWFFFLKQQLESFPPFSLSLHTCFLRSPCIHILSLNTVLFLNSIFRYLYTRSLCHTRIFAYISFEELKTFVDITH